MKTESVAIKHLTLLERNPRKISKEQLNKLCKSIAEDPEFLFNRPVLVNLVDGKHIVYAGNQRVRAAKSLKMEEIPCIIEKDLPYELVQKRILKDNKTYGEFDWDILANEYEIDMLLDCGFEADDLLGSVHEIDTNGIGEDKEEGKKSSKTCPHCNGIL
jgi:ParB-like chromosome segregation protein Spo0J